MIVYGDHSELASGAEILDRIEGRLARSSDLDNHTAAIILAGQLQQGVMDFEHRTARIR